MLLGQTGREGEDVSPTGVCHIDTLHVSVYMYIFTYMTSQAGHIQTHRTLAQTQTAPTA